IFLFSVYLLTLVIGSLFTKTRESCEGPLPLFSRCVWTEQGKMEGKHCETKTILGFETWLVCLGL
ncbi:unnamed protein product, partial [Brassica oleracea]